jgi:ribose 1,5-bisphosphokinase PhnN
LNSLLREFGCRLPKHGLADGLGDFLDGHPGGEGLEYHALDRLGENAEELQRDRICDDFENAFDAAVANGDFLEWEEVYPGAKYGTLKQEVDRLWADGKVVFFDMDVEGALRLKRQFGDQALAVYIEAPSMEILEQRLRNRGTDTEEKIQIRLGKAALEAQRAPQFDVRIVNDELDRATEALRSAVDAFLTDSGLDGDSATDSSSAVQPA